MSATKKLFSKLLAEHTVDVGPVSYITRKDLAVISHSACNAVLDVAATKLRAELLNGYYDTYELCDILTQYGYLSNVHATMIVFCSNSFASWRRRAAGYSPVFDLDPFWKAGESRIVSKRIDIAVTPSVFTAA